MIRSASSTSGEAMTAEVGRLRATSAARLGPDSAATRPAMAPPAASTTWLIRSRVSRSSPLTTDSRSASGARCGATDAVTVRRCADGAAKITRSVASASTAGSAVARTVGGRSTPGNRDSLRPVSRIRAAVASLWHSRVTGSTRATRRASVVPHAPAPMTATRGPPPSPISGSGDLGAASAACRPWPASGCPSAWSTVDAFLRRGSLTDARSRNTSRTGVPSKPNVSRSRFSRYRR